MLVSVQVPPLRSEPVSPLGPRKGRSSEFAKIAFDRFLAVLLIILFAPLIAAIALAIWATEGRPLVFRHERIGRHGERFGCLKFRTMIRDADAALAKRLACDPDLAREWHEARKLRDDPRVLGGIGRFLRRTSLDELPQLINVLRGEMSIVGPRPIVEAELLCYGEFAGHYLSVRPGLTGPWQIGGRNDTSYARRVRMDADYVENWSVAGDIWISLRTARVLFGSSNAY